MLGTGNTDIIRQYLPSGNGHYNEGDTMHMEERKEYLLSTYCVASIVLNLSGLVLVAMLGNRHIIIPHFTMEETEADRG